MTRNDAIAYRSKIEAAASTMTDETALTAVNCSLYGQSAMPMPQTTGCSTTARCTNAFRRTLGRRTGRRTRHRHCGSLSAWTHGRSGCSLPARTMRITGGGKVSYRGKHYICTADANVYAPDVYGWEEAA